MKNIITCFCFVIGIALSYGQTNPFEKYNFKPKIGTLSKGKYIEHFDNDSIVKIGSVLLNVHTEKVVGFIIKEVRYSEATLEPEIVSRWMSPDPLADEFPSQSPYNFVENNPIRFVDPLGLAPYDVILDGSESAVNKVLENINSGLGGSYASVDENGMLNINISDDARGNLDENQAAFLGVLEEGINADGVMTINVVEGDEVVRGGSFSGEVIDIDDINALGDGPAMNQNSVLGHEFKEQFEKQINGKKRPEAHAAGEQAEASITGYARGKDSPMQNKKLDKVVKRERYATRTYYTVSGTKTFNFSKGNEKVSVSVSIVRGNFVKVDRKKQ